MSRSDQPARANVFDGSWRGPARSNADDNDLFLILTGRLRVDVNRRKVAEGVPGQHVGEMALIDPSARRSATVMAEESTVVAKVSEPDFTTVADKYSRLWRRLSIELSDRLRRREQFHTLPNSRPVVFIGSSSERWVKHEYDTGAER